MYNILICDDDRDIAAAVEIYLSTQDCRILMAHDGQEALELVRREDIHLVLMDIMMPKMDGITATARIRQESNVPIILLTAKGESSDKVLGLNIGADDYVTKPFDPAELQARVRSQLRRYTALGARAGQEEQGVFTVGNISLNENDRAVTVDGDSVALTALEYSILRLLMKNPGRVFSSREIYESVWNEEALGSENAVAVHIRHLRQKIEITPSEPRYLKVVWGLGYKMEKDKA
ncbi:MAG: response regulator transcription factor [Clostridiales bacterium]|nr:response regulator transcription factor [Candidatus Apopatocola equi]MCQ2439190.1 response regulator transcription factor [Oscillospiraceae bacterium]